MSSGVFDHGTCPRGWASHLGGPASPSRKRPAYRGPVTNPYGNALARARDARLRRSSGRGGRPEQGEPERGATERRESEGRIGAKTPGNGRQLDPVEQRRPVLM